MSAPLTPAEIRARARAELLKRVRSALERTLSQTKAAALLETTPRQVRRWIKAYPKLVEGLEMAPEGWAKGRPRKAPK